MDKWSIQYSSYKKLKYKKMGIESTMDSLVYQISWISRSDKINE